MSEYLYAWTPLGIVLGAITLLAIPYLAPLVLLVIVLVALAALARAIVSVPYMLSRAVARHRRGRTGAPRTAAALSPAGRRARTP